MWTTIFVCVTILAASYARNEDPVDCSDHLIGLMELRRLGNQDGAPTCLIEAGLGEIWFGTMIKGQRILDSNHIVVPNNATMVATLIKFAGRNADLKKVLTQGCKMTNPVLMCVVKKRNELKCNNNLIELLGGSPSFFNDIKSEYNLFESEGLQPCTDLAKLLMLNYLYKV